MDLILKCIHNHPQARAHASEIVGRLAEMVLQFPASFANRLEMLRQIEAITRENQDLRDENRELREDNKQIEILTEQNRNLMKDLREEIERKDGEIQELRMENELLKIEMKTILGLL